MADQHKHEFRGLPGRQWRCFCGELLNGPDDLAALEEATPLDVQYADRSHLGSGPADHVKYLGMAGNGTQYSVSSDTQE